MFLINVSTRGAVRHWVIGCLGVIAVLVLVFAGGGYYMFKKVSPTTFDVTAKADPPADASTDMLLPEKVGTFERGSIGQPDPTAGDFVSTGTKAYYYDASGQQSASVIALPTEDMQQAQAGRRPGAWNGETNSRPGNTGMSVKIPFGQMKMELALWSKQNWSYIVQTTNSTALDFAREFNPVGSAEETTSTR